MQTRLNARDLRKGQRWMRRRRDMSLHAANILVDIPTTLDIVHGMRRDHMGRFIVQQDNRPFLQSRYCLQ